MSLVNSLLTAMLRADGDALVLHVGERPYVVTGVGNVDLSNTVLTLDAVTTMLPQLLPPELLTTLVEVGAVEHQLQPPSSMRDAFTVVAARGGQDMWIEIRRKRAVVRVAAAPVPPSAPRTATSERSGDPSLPLGAVAHPVPPGLNTDPSLGARSAIPPGVSERTTLMEAGEKPAGGGITLLQPEGPTTKEAAPAAPGTETEPAQGPEVDSDLVRDPGNPPPPAVVVPLTRVVRVDSSTRNGIRDNVVQRLLALAASRSGEQIYFTSQSRPFMRVEGEMRPVDAEPPFSPADVDSIVQELIPETARDTYRRGEPAEWTAEFESVGRVRCATFRDHRGPGVVFHLTTTRPLSAEQLGLARDIQSLATEPEGLVVITSPRGGGKSTLVAALVDLINRQHSVSVITIERQVRIVHDNRLAFVSQREVRGPGADALAMVRAALRECPDVLILEDLKSPEIVQLAVDAAGSGRLVILTAHAATTVSALASIVESFPPGSRKAALAALADRLRGVVSQVLLRRNGGGRVVARELLLPSPSVASWIADGQFAQLTSALESGREAGLVSLNHVLLSLVKSGTVDPGEAYRKVENRAALLRLLEHHGVDTSLFGRLA